MLNIPAGWKPIESAPKDGTDILLTNGVHVSCGHWHYDEGGTTEHRDLDGRYIGQDDRDGFAGWLDWMGGMTPNPTHWMPLPAAPGSVSPSAPGDAQEPLKLVHLAVAEDGGVRFMTGRKLPAGIESCELYAMPDYGRAPAELFRAPAAGDALADPTLQKLFGEAITGALAFGAQGVNQPPVGHWLEPFWKMARADAALAARLALLDHPLLRDVLGYVEDAGPADVWGAAQSWMALRDAALAAQVPHNGDAA